MNEKTAWYLGVGRDKIAKLGLGKLVRGAFRSGSRGKEIAKPVMNRRNTIEKTLMSGAHFAGKNPLAAGGIAAGTAGATGLAAGAAAGSAHEKNKPFMSRLMG